MSDPQDILAKCNEQLQRQQSEAVEAYVVAIMRSTDWRPHTHKLVVQHHWVRQLAATGDYTIRTSFWMEPIDTTEPEMVQQ
jgi:hypothetical protein